MRSSATYSSIAARSWPLTRFPPIFMSFPWLRLAKQESWCAAMRNAIVTGGSRGLGLGIARKLITSGFRVLVIARKESSELAAAKLEVEQTHPGSLHFQPCDLADLDAIPEMVRKLRKEFGPIYGLVNNAGMSTDG